MAYRRNEGAVIYILTSAQVRGDDYRRALGAEHLRRVEIMQTRKFFRDLGPFKHWRPESFMQLADKATRRHIPAHAVVARRGASCDTVAFVVQGELKLEGAVAVGTQRKSVDLLRRLPCRPKFTIPLSITLQVSARVPCSATSRSQRV